MNEGGNCPAGSSLDKNAPWNLEDQPEREFQVLCSQTLSKTSRIFSSNYTTIAERETDTDGCYTFVEYDTSDMYWKEEYHENGHYTPLQLIEVFQKYLLDEVNGSNTTNRNSKYLNWLISECNNWTEDETIYMEG